MTFHIEAEYLNDDDRGYVKGKIYTLQVEQRLFGRIRVCATRGYDMFPIQGYELSYPNMMWFLFCWKTTKVIGQWANHLDRQIPPM